jgi:hypothetical protein
MLVFFIFPVLSYEITDLVACVQLVKWKIDNFDESFDKILALSKLDPETHLDKIIAGMIIHCASSLTSEIRSEMHQKENFLNLDHLVPFPPEPLTRESDLELTTEEDKALDQLQEYTKNLEGPNKSLIYLSVSFAIVISFVLLPLIYSELKRQKLIKID